jgi:hypothetical protein
MLNSIGPWPVNSTRDVVRRQKIRGKLIHIYIKPRICSKRHGLYPLALGKTHEPLWQAIELQFSPRGRWPLSIPTATYASIYFKLDYRSLALPILRVVNTRCEKKINEDKSYCSFVSFLVYVSMGDVVAYNTSPPALLRPFIAYVPEALGLASATTPNLYRVEA